jgi:hypothetical protein
LEIARHRVIPDAEKVTVLLDGFDPILVTPQTTVTALLRRVKGAEYSKYSLVVKNACPASLASVESLANKTRELQGGLIVRASPTYRERTAIPSEVLLKSRVFSLLYACLKNESPELRALLDKLPNFPSVAELFRSSEMPTDYATLFPFGFPAVFLYNFEVLLTERSLNQIPVECLNVLVNGLTISESGLNTSILCFLEKNWPLPVDLQLLFDKLLVMINEAVRAVPLPSAALHKSLDFGVRFVNPDLSIPSDFGNVLCELLLSPQADIREKGAAFLKHLRIRFTFYANVCVPPIPPLSAEFFSSAADHFGQPNSTVFNRLYEIVADLSQPLEVGHLNCLCSLLERGWFSQHGRSMLSRHMIARFFSHSRCPRSPALFSAACNVLAILHTSEISEHLKKMFMTSRQTSWRCDGDALAITPSHHKVGLINLGMTCFMNAVLHQFFAILEFRNLLMLYTGEDPVTRAVSRLFAHLQMSEAEAVTTRGIVDVWTRNTREKLNPKVQEDACVFTQEFLEKLEKSIPETVPMFQVCLLNRIETMNGDRFSENQEKFNVLPLAVENCRNFDESLQKLSEPDIINQYRIGDEFYDVRKITEIESLPDRLIIQLKRFEYSFNTYRRYKVTSHYDFQMKVTIKTRDYLLRGVVVHRGDVDAGHYLSYIREKDIWYCYNDSSVTQVTDQQMFQEAAIHGYLLFYCVETPPFELRLLTTLKNEVLSENQQLHIKRIINTRAFFRAMEGWAKSGSELAVMYLFTVLPYCAEQVAGMADRISRPLLMALPEMEIQRWLFDAIAACPIIAVRSAAVDVFLALFRRNPTIEVFDHLLHSITVHTFFTMDIAWRMVHQIIREFEPMKAHMIKNGNAVVIEEFLMKSIPEHLAQRNETERYGSIDMSNFFRVIAFNGPSAGLREFCLGEGWLEKIIKSVTDVMAIVELLRSFDNQEQVLAIIQRFADEDGKCELFEVVIQKLLES